MLLFDLEIPDKPIKDSSFNQCLWQLKKDGNGIMGKFTELLTNSDWKSSRCTMEWKAEYIKKNRYILLLHINKIETFGLLPTPKAMECPSASWENRNPESKYKPGVTLTDLKVWGLLPTPESFDWNSARHPELWEKDKKKYSEKGINLHCNFKSNGNMQLNPQFVLEMMGFPIDFTEKPFQNLE